MRKLCCVLLTAVFVLSLVACNNDGQTANEKDLVSLLSGSWYSDGNQEPAFILYEDGTCEIANEHGTGTWSVENENQLKLTNYYGETRVATINELTDDRLVLGNGNDAQIFFEDKFFDSY